MTVLPPEYLDPRTPDDVVVTDVRAEPIDDPTVGQPLGTPDGDLPTVPPDPAHLLVTVGDSLTHGVSSGAVFHTDLSWPALVAVGVGASDFKVPVYRGPLDGLPLNIEALLHQLQQKFGDDLSLFEKLELTRKRRSCIACSMPTRTIGNAAAVTSHRRTCDTRTSASTAGMFVMPSRPRRPVLLREPRSLRTTT